MMKFNSFLKHALLSTIVLIFSCSLFAQTAKPSAAFTPAQKKQIEKIIYNYLVSNPEVLVQASHALQQKEMQNMKKIAVDATRANASSMLRNPMSPVVGDKTGKVTLVAFLDYQCVHCRGMTSIIAGLIKQNPHLRVVFKEFPIFGPDSMRAAQAALAANMQNKYFALHQAFMSSQIPFNKANVIKMAKKVGINIEKLKKGMQLNSIKEEIKNNYRLAHALQLIGTPAFIVTQTNLTSQSKTPIEFFPGQTSQQALQNMIDRIQQTTNLQQVHFAKVYDANQKI